MSPRRSTRRWVYFSCSERRHWAHLRNGHDDFYPDRRILFAKKAQADRFVRYANQALQNGVIVTDAGEIV
jgi:hypothetical protein